MNKRLKFRIIEEYDTQAKFCDAIREAEAVVSRVIHERINLSKAKRRQWAAALRTTPEEIFPGV